MTNKKKYNKMLQIVRSFVDACWYLCITKIEDGKPISFLRKVSKSNALDYIDVFELKERQRDNDAILYN